MTDADKMHTDTKRALMAAMETGNHDRARTLIREYQEYDFLKAQALRADVVKSYGTDL